MEIPIEAKIECSDICRSKCDPETTLSIIGGIGIQNLTNEIKTRELGAVTANLELTCISGPDHRGRCQAGVRIGIVDSIGAEVLTSYMVRPQK